MYLPLLKFNPPYNQTYKFHPAISICLSYAIYGDAMVCAIGADESDINQIWCSAMQKQTNGTKMPYRNKKCRNKWQLQMEWKGSINSKIRPWRLMPTLHSIWRYRVVIYWKMAAPSPSSPVKLSNERSSCWKYLAILKPENSLYSAKQCDAYEALNTWTRHC